MTQKVGYVTQVIGPVVDVIFEGGGVDLPPIYEALEIERENGSKLIVEVEQHVVLHGVMDTPSPYFNKYRWGYSCTDNNISACISYYDKIFGALQNPAKGTYCNIFRLHLEPG